MMRRFLACLVCGGVVSLAALGQNAPGKMQANPAGAGGTQAEIDAAVKLICPAGKITHGKDGSVSGCSVCPKGTDFFGQLNTSWEMRSTIRGHFATATNDNLLLDGTGCDSHANNLGGTFVFALKDGKPRLLRYENGLITDRCQKFAFADKRNGLVCRGGWMGQGEADLTVFVTSFNATGIPTSKVLIHVTDTTGTCGDDAGQVVDQGGIAEVQFVPKPHVAPGEISGLTIKAETGKVKCSVVEAAQKTRRAPASVKSYTVDYTFDGRQFQVAPGSRTILAKFGRFSAE